MTSIDVDGGGLLEFDEITTYIRRLGEEAPSRISSLENYCFYSEVGSEDRRFMPPDTGKVRIEIIDSYKKGGAINALTHIQCLDIIQNTNKMANPALMLLFAAENVKLLADEGVIIHNALAKQSGDSISALAKLMPHLASYVDCRKLMKVVCKADLKKVSRLRFLLGNAFAPLLGFFDGFYSLDLSKDSDQICLAKLLEQSQAYTFGRQSNGLWDVSQDGNWTCFRNEYFAGKYSSITVGNFTPMPKSGKLEFDFVGATRPDPKIDKPMSDRKL